MFDATTQLSALQSTTYPSNCLYFLSRIAVEDAIDCSKTSLNIIVVGAGLGGLSTAIALATFGHKVTIYEQASELGEVGAGIQIPPNSSRLLIKLGVGPYLAECASEPMGISFRRWENGNLLGFTRLLPDFRETFNAPYYVVHRADLHAALVRRSSDLGVTLKLGQRVVDYDVNEPSICLESGGIVTADLVVAADGIKSIARQLLHPKSDKPPRNLGFAAYRATIDVNLIKDDPDTAWLLEKPALNIWIGDKRHVMTYTIGAGKSFNMVLSHWDPRDPATWDQSTALQDMRREFTGWDPRLTKIIERITKTIKWPLVSSTPLTRWTSGKVVILGDAAHAMLPYMSQGAAMAVEDGVALARALSKIQSKAEIGHAISVFETVRVERTRMMQEASLINGQLWHFPDGPLQRARDEAMSPETQGRPFSHSSNQWSDPATQIWAYGYVMP
ncbi:conserved hypothetical protein [Aspergillus niger]|uniref:FAD-binding domain-containing protein n=1 Tax=Aspergillus niger TaxID=5061 RepID=A0A100IRB4_ASPNG|nr:conserved hypothetical protein [Aspergillus niger]